MKRSGSMQSYMEGLPGSVAALADTVLKVNGTDLPVHRAILAFISPVFADLFAFALSRRSKTTTRLEIPLVNDEVQDVRTALGYLYRGCTVCSSSAPQLESTDDAKSLVKFASKYSIKSLLEACETHLTDCLQHEDYLSTTDAMVEWTALAEECGLNTFLALCELQMINNQDRRKWCHPAMTSNKISRRCLLRMLRGLQFQQRKSDDFITCMYEQMAKDPEAEQVQRTLGCIPCTRPHHSVPISKLMDWKK